MLIAKRNKIVLDKLFKKNVEKLRFNLKYIMISLI